MNAYLEYISDPTDRKLTLALISLVVYGLLPSIKNEEDFQ